MSAADKFASVLLEIATSSEEGWDEQMDFAKHILHYGFAKRGELAFQRLRDRTAHNLFNSRV